MKDNEMARLVQELVVCANKYHGSQQLRDRISEIVQDVVDPLNVANTNVAITLREVRLKLDSIQDLCREATLCITGDI